MLPVQLAQPVLLAVAAMDGEEAPGRVAVVPEEQVQLIQEVHLQQADGRYT